MPATLMSVRGWMTYIQTADTAVHFASKMMLVEYDDAGAMPMDHEAIDTDEEDIARRQLWTYYGYFNPRAATTREQITIEVNVKIKIRIPSAGKHALVVVSDAEVTNRVFIAGYLRGLLLMG